MKNLKVPMPTGAVPPLDARVRARIAELKQKLQAQRDPNNLDNTLRSPLLTGRTEGNIGALEWVLRLLEGKDE